MKQNTILVVDDDQHVINVISRALIREGYDVRTAMSGEAALEALKTKYFDLIISDQMMSGIAGTVLFEKAKEFCPDAIRILLTGHADVDILMEAINQGEIYRFFTKPLEITNFLISIRDALERKALIEEKEELIKRLQGKKIFEEMIIDSRDKLMSIFDTVHETIFSVDPEYNIVSANRAFFEKIGKGRENIIGQKCYTIRHGLDVPCFDYGYDCPARGVFESGKSYFTTSSYTVQNGRKRYNEFSMLPIKNSAGEVIRVVRITRDITEQKEAAEEIWSLNKNLSKALSEVKEKNVDLEETLKKLKETQSQLLQSEKMASIGQLAAGVAHEINNPIGFINSNLGSLKGYLEDLSRLIHMYEELQKEVLSRSEQERNNRYANLVTAIDRHKEETDYEFVMNDLEKLISESQEGTERVKKIVADLKDFAHIDEPDMRYADINKCIESTLNIVWNELKYKTTVTKDLGDVPEIYCYPNKLNQVFMNLLVNAAQAIETKGEIRISTRFCNSDDPCVEIKISDTGSGIPQENLSRIFDPFFTTKPVGKGTGLGLNMAYGIIEKHHGRIDVESEVGKGTTFTIILPVRDEAMNKD